MIRRFLHTTLAVATLLCCFSFVALSAESQDTLQFETALVPLDTLESLESLDSLDSLDSLGFLEPLNSLDSLSPHELLQISASAELADSLFYPAELQVSFRVNRAEMSDSTALVRFVSNCLLPATLDKGWRLDHIVIRGAASPEGPWENNRRLAKKRAQALSSRIAQLMPASSAVNDSLLVETQVVEDYQRLLYLLHEASDSLENVVSAVMSEESGDEKRIKSRLMSHNNGRTWRYLLKRYFPQLRSARVIFVMTPPSAEAVAQFRLDMQDGELARRYAAYAESLPLAPRASQKPLKSLESLSSLTSEAPQELLASSESLDSSSSSASAEESPLQHSELLQQPHSAPAELSSDSFDLVTENSSLSAPAEQLSAPVEEAESPWHMIAVCLIVILLLLVALLLYRIKKLREEIDEFSQLARRPTVMSSMPLTTQVSPAPKSPEKPAPAESPLPLDETKEASPETPAEVKVEDAEPAVLVSEEPEIPSAAEETPELPQKPVVSEPETAKKKQKPLAPSEEPERGKVASLSAADQALLNRAKAFVEENMSREDLSSEDLAAHLGMTESLLNRRMRKFTGDTAKRYILSQRMLRAADLLSTTDMSVRDIALVCGFSDQSYFARMVKQCTGRTPSQHRASSTSEEPLIEGIFDGMPE